MSNSQQNKVVAVTGAAGGIGRAVCERLRRDGATVYALDLRSPDGPNALAVDVTDHDSVEQAFSSIRQQESRVDAVVAAAGIVEDDVAAEAMSSAQFSAVLAVNLTGVFHTLTSAGRIMLEQGSGSCVAISSMSGTHTVNTPQRQCAYNASKAGVSALVRSLAAEWAGRGVRVNAIAPGYIATELLARKTHQFEQWLQHTPQGRMGLPEDVAGTVAFLLSDEASYFCGSELLMDGGYSLV